MHLLRTQPGGFVPDDSIADMGQTPAELVILCSGDSSLALLAEAARQLPEDAKADPVAGQKTFATLCAACHGPEGKGM
ncbi:hypothetical protein F2S74_28765, partial [Pseudomonas syringae pv. actinidiae]|nr:hypothetical protein [Pseudomonas syringae pv. actinidiae]